MVKQSFYVFAQLCCNTFVIPRRKITSVKCKFVNAIKTDRPYNFTYTAESITHVRNVYRKNKM